MGVAQSFRVQLFTTTGMRTFSYYFRVRIEHQVHSMLSQGCKLYGGYRMLQIAEESMRNERPASVI